MSKKQYKPDIEFKLFKRIKARIKNELPDFDRKVEHLIRCSLCCLLNKIKYNTLKHFVSQTKNLNYDWNQIYLHHVKSISPYKNNHYYAFYWTNLKAID